MSFALYVIGFPVLIGGVGPHHSRGTSPLRGHRVRHHARHRHLDRGDPDPVQGPSGLIGRLPAGRHCFHSHGPRPVGGFAGGFDGRDVTSELEVSPICASEA